MWRELTESMYCSTLLYSHNYASGNINLFIIILFIYSCEIPKEAVEYRLYITIFSSYILSFSEEVEAQ